MGFSFEKVMIILLIAALLVGPDRLPRYASALASFVRKVRDFTNETKTRVKQEAGDDLDDIDWRQLDPRRYDPRRIILDAWNDTGESSPSRPARRKTSNAAVAATATPDVSAVAASVSASAVEPSSDPAQAPRTVVFDDEAT